MKLYSVLLIDDEEEVSQAIMKKLDWNAMGFQIAGYAKNGLEALELAEEIQPDVVMTDIKMPYMDGLTLSKKLREQYPNLKIIIFSGFDEFEYAKEAIKIEAEEYILKPIESGELQNVFERIKENLDRELDEKRNIDKLKEYYNESLPLLQENFFISLLEDRIPEKKLLQYINNYQINLDSPYYIVTILHVSSNLQNPDMNSLLMGLSVKKLAEEKLVERWHAKILSYLGEIVVIGQIKEKEMTTRYTDEMERFCKLAKRVCNVSVTAGVGYLCDNVSALAASYDSARLALSYRVLYGHNRAINIVEIDPQDTEKETKKEEISGNRLFKAIKLGDKNGLSEEVEALVKNLFAVRSSIQKYRINVMELVVDIFRFGSSSQINMEQIFGESQDMYQEILQLETSDEVYDWLLHTAQVLQEEIVTKRIDSTKSFVKKAEEYVLEHFRDQNLTVESMCRILGVSSAYFSTVFKKETGKTFINYLTDYRMEQAVELLLSSDVRTYIVAEQTGYTDPNYFSYVFKKKYGVSPSKYRRENDRRE